MAISITTSRTVPFVGIVELPTYVRVSHIAGNKHGMTANLQLLHNNAAGEEIENRSVTFAPNLDGANFIRQAYLHLKTLPEFANAVDC